MGRVKRQWKRGRKIRKIERRVGLEGVGGRPERKNESGHLGIIWSANLEALFFTRRI